MLPILSSVSPGILSMVVYAGHHPNKVKTVCILDTGAGQTTVDLKFAEKLNLPLGPPRTKRLGYLDRVVEIRTRHCLVPLTSQDEKHEVQIEAQAVEGLADNCHLWPWSNFLRNHPHLKDITVPDYPLPPVGTMLIGADNVELLQALEYRKSNRPGRPMGLRTKMGWAFMGPDPPGEDTLPGDGRVKITPALKVSVLESILNRQFEIENLGALEEEPSPSQEGRDEDLQTI